MAKETTTQEKKRYSLTVTTVLQGDGDSTPMVNSTVQWNDLDYLGATILEDLMMNMLNQTSELGYAASVAKGVVSQDDLAKTLAVVDKIKGKKK